MIVLVYSIVLLRELLVSTIFLHGPSLHRRFLHLLHIFFAERSYAHAHVNATPRVMQRK